MKKIILSAEDGLIERARLLATARGTTLNTALRGWLEQYASQSVSGSVVNDLMRRLRHEESTGPYSRDQMNER